MKKLKTSYMLGAVSTIAVIIALGMTLYIRQIDVMLAGMAESTMHEIADHDMAFVESILDRSWVSLEHIAKRLQDGRSDSIGALQIRLNLERSSSFFQNIYLVDSTGKIYSGAFLITDGLQRPWVRDILAQRSHTVYRYSRSNIRVDDQQEIITYAVCFRPFAVGGVTFVGIVGQTNIQSVRKHMSLSSFGGRGLSYVVDTAGDYIVNDSDTTGIGAQPNLFRQLSGASFSGGYSLEKLDKDIASRRNIFCRLRHENVDYMLHMQYLETAPWYMAVLVPSDVFAAQGRKFLLLTIVMLLLVLAVVVMVLLFSLRAWRSTLNARAAAAAESEFLSRMSHEIRTPLNALIGLNYLMKKELGDRDRLSEYLDKSESTSHYLLSLINDILDISKFRQHKAELAHEPFSLAETAELAQTMMKSKMDEKGIDFEVSCELPYPCVVGDGMRLKQVLLNILSNAVKFTPRGGRVKLELTQTSEEGSHVVTKISVSDNGIGMSDEFRTRIFDSFSQENRAEGAGGTGLGMTISYLIMKQMGGDLTVESKIGKGSRFTAILPAATAAELSAPAGGAVTSGSGRRGLRVLIAEDNEMNSLILSNILNEEGCSSVVAENGQKAVDIFEASACGEFSLILMDAQMPVMDGYTAARKIRGLARRDAGLVRIFACTANTTQDNRDRARESGMDGFLAKPIDVGKLFEVLDCCSRKDDAQ